MNYVKTRTRRKADRLKKQEIHVWKHVKTYYKLLSLQNCQRSSYQPHGTYMNKYKQDVLGVILLKRWNKNTEKMADQANREIIPATLIIVQWSNKCWTIKRLLDGHCSLHTGPGSHQAISYVSSLQLNKHMFKYNDQSNI